MDFFYVWLRRTLHGLSDEIDAAFSSPLSPKWDHDRNDGELIDDASRFGNDKAASKKNYEDGMACAFAACHAALSPEGRLVVVFAHKHPDAWETLTWTSASFSATCAASSWTSWSGGC
jgi:putative DNA methylase